jgi:Integrase core domain/Pol polyprotein, beta-barrel domain
LIQAHGHGTIDLKVIAKGEKRVVHLSSALYVPDLRNSLLSIKTLNHCQFSIHFAGGQCLVKSASGKIIAKSTRGGNLFNLHLQPHPVASLACSNTSLSLDLIHKCLGHINIDSLRCALCQGALASVDDLVDTTTNDMFFDACICGKMASTPFQLGHTHATTHLECVHSDICGPFEVQSLGGNSYFATLIDDFTRYMWVKPMKLKSEFNAWYIEKDTEFLNQYGNHIGILQSDNGGKYIGNTMVQYCAKVSTTLEHSIPRTPQQNGVAEQANHTIDDKTHSNMKETGCPLNLWADTLALIKRRLDKGWCDHSLVATNGMQKSVGEFCSS